jgi:exopolysaccharide biosynthesis protein
LNPDVVVLSLSPELVTRTPAAVRADAGAIVKISTETVPELKGVKSAISGGYVLVRDGRTETLRVPPSTDYKYASVTNRHPRSAIGASRDHFFLLEVDGRQPGHSVGMTLAELGGYMQKLGCELAVSLDGGASATFWWNGRIMNRPCNGADRPIANGLVVLKKTQARP